MTAPTVAKIKVYVRCRPIEENELSVVEFPIDHRSIVVVDKRARDRRYEMDTVFHMKTPQQRIYETVAKPVVLETIKGYNCTIFAYGQTGTGKTFTIVGDRSDPLRYRWADDPRAGIIPRSIADVFKHLAATGNEFSVRVSFLEIYNESLRDLLYSGADPPRLQIYDCQTNRGAVRVQNLSELAVASPEQAYDLLEKGMRNRQTAATNMNLLSSRSHAVFSIQTTLRRTMIEGKDQVVMGKLHLVDLAGSECIGRSGATDTRAREAGKINASLLTLERVINALLLKGHVPFRESKLTRLLQDSLGGSTKTSIIATISPSRINIEETLSTLDYAHKAKDITNRPIINLKEQCVILQDYEMEIRKLRDDLALSREKQGVYLSEARYQEMLDRVDLLENKCKTMAEDIAMKTESIEELVRDNRNLQKNLLEEEFIVQTYSANEQTLHGQADKTLQILVSAQNMCHTLKGDFQMCLQRDQRHRKAVNEARTVQMTHLDSIRSMLQTKCKEMEVILTSATEDLRSRHEKLYNYFQNNIKGLQHDFNVVMSFMHESSEVVSPIMKRLSESLDEMSSQTQSYFQEENKSLEEYQVKEKQLVTDLKTDVENFEKHSRLYEEEMRNEASVSQNELSQFIKSIDQSQQSLSSFCEDIHKQTDSVVKKLADLTSLNKFVQHQQQIQKRREESVRIFNESLQALQEEENSIVASLHQQQKEHCQSCVDEWNSISTHRNTFITQHLTTCNEKIEEHAKQQEQCHSHLNEITNRSLQYQGTLRENILSVLRSQEDVRSNFCTSHMSHLSSDNIHRNNVSTSIEKFLQQLHQSLKSNKEIGEKSLDEIRGKCCRKLDDVAIEVSDNLRHASGYSSSIAEHCNDTVMDCMSNLDHARSNVDNLCQTCCEQPPLEEVPELRLRYGDVESSSDDYVSAVPLPWSLTKSREEVLLAYKRGKRSRLYDTLDFLRSEDNLCVSPLDPPDTDEKENEPKVKRGKIE